MYQVSFNGCWAKVNRARNQFDSLQREFSRFCESNPYTIRHEHDLNTGEKMAVFYATQPIPIEWSIILGEIIHDLRSSLDHAIYQLTIINNGSPLSGTEFPIFEDKDKYFSNRRGGGHHKIRDLSEKTKTVIDGLQPFSIKKPGKEAVIWLLHELSNIDKHRTIHLCHRSTSYVELRVIRDITPISLDFILVRKLEDGAILARWKLASGLDDEMDMDAKVAFNIGFDDILPSLEGKAVVDVLESVIRGVERVLHYLFTSVKDPPSTEKV